MTQTSQKFQTSSYAMDGLLHNQNVTTVRLFLCAFNIRRNGETEERGKKSLRENRKEIEGEAGEYE